MTKVFISYAHDDVECALYLYNAFRSCGVDVWMDVYDIPPGTQNWDRLIHSALSECTHLALIHTQNSFNSDEVWSEWRQFLRYGKTVIPLIAENVELPFRLNSVQFVDFYTTPFEEAFAKLLDAILNQFPTPPDWTGSSKLLPLSHINAESDYTTPLPENDRDVFNRLPSEQSNRIHWAAEILAKQLIQRKLLEQYSRTILNLESDDTPPPRDNVIHFDLSLRQYLFDCLDFDLPLRHRIFADNSIHPDNIKPFIYHDSLPDSNDLTLTLPDTDCKAQSTVKYNQSFSTGQIRRQSSQFTFSRDNNKYRAESVFHKSFVIPIKTTRVYSN